MNDVRLGSIRFGYTDAQSEFTQAPYLLREGYYDVTGAEDKLLSDAHFLVLGYKGAGKSMVSARFRALSADSPNLYSCPEPITIRDLALADLRKVIPDSFDAPARAHWSWVLYLCVAMVEAIEHDGRASEASRERVREGLRILRSHQVISKSPRSLQKLKTTKMVTTIKFPKFAEQSWEFDQSTSDQTIQVWIKFMTLLLQSHESARRCFLFVDGLDDLGPLKEGNALLLGGLISASSYLNGLLQEGKAPLKVVVCCRTDLYERLDAARKSKIRSDFGIELDWYQDPRDVDRTHLARLVDKRASVSGLKIPFFKHFFPSRIDGQPALNFLAMNTRHTPRDFLAIMRSIQEVAPSQVTELNRDQILAGVRNYSRLYFIGEMDDALDNYFDIPTKRKVLDAVGRLRSQDFTREEFSGVIKGVGEDAALEALFECNFLGAVTQNPRRPYFRFHFRNPAVRVANEDRLTIHPGLWKAFNLA